MAATNPEPGPSKGLTPLREAVNDTLAATIWGMEATAYAAYDAARADAYAAYSAAYGATLDFPALARQAYRWKDAK